MSTRNTLAALFLSATLAGSAAPALAQEGGGTTYKVDVPERVEIDVGTTDGTSARTYLVIGLSTAAVIGLLLLVVLLARSGDGGHTHVHHHH
jgi:hypothetical protein